MTDAIEQVRELTGEIDGWLSPMEGELIYKLAKNVPTQQVIVEIGSWKGKSTVWLAKGAEAGQRNKVYSIDPHQGSKTHLSEGEADTYRAFLANLSRTGVQAAVIPLVTTSDNAAKDWQGKHIGLLWLDGSHDYDDVKRDIVLWKQHLSKGAMLALHDCDKPRPARVVEENFVNSNEFTIICSVDTIVVAIKC